MSTQRAKNNWGFIEEFNELSWENTLKKIYNTSETEVLASLNKKGRRNLNDFAHLISPAAAPYLLQMAEQAHQLTLKRFGNTVQMYIPMYLSNECQNICTYCGFSLDVDIPRKTLTDEEIIREAEYLKAKGYEHILLVTGEANKTVGVDYFEHAIDLLKPYFAYISIEVQPLEQEEYERLIAKGLHAVLVYQETYRKEDYKKHHPKGKKSNFEYRLNTPDRLGKAGIHKMGLGALIGLEDWRVDSYYTAAHLAYLYRNYWQTKYSISFPRLRPCAGGPVLKSEMTDKQLVQLITAYRLCFENVELSISTRENASFRDQAMKIGVTSMSAESKTEPGGYTAPKEALEQFEIDDDRTTEEMVRIIEKQGYEAVFKDWDQVLMR